MTTFPYQPDHIQMGRSHFERGDQPSYRRSVFYDRRQFCFINQTLSITPLVVPRSPGQPRGWQRLHCSLAFKLLVQLLNATYRVRNELLLGRRTRVACVGHGEWVLVGANAGLSEHVGEGVQRLVERCRVRYGTLSTTAWMPRVKPS